MMSTSSTFPLNASLNSIITIYNNNNNMKKNKQIKWLLVTLVFFSSSLCFLCL